jgi:site-specific recombinase XerD
MHASPTCQTAELDLGMDISTALENFLGEHSDSPRTQRGYRCDLGFFLRHLGRKGIREVKELDSISIWSGFCTERFKDRLRPCSKARIVGSLRSFSRFLFRQELLYRSPADALQRPKVPQELPRYMEPAAVDSLLSEPDRSEGRDYYRARGRSILEFFYSTGCRVSELCEVNLDDLQLSEGRVKLLHCKGGKQRMAFLGQPCIDAIRAWLLERKRKHQKPDEALFVSYKGGRRLDPTSVRHIVAKYAKAAGVGHVTPHRLRHSMATHALWGGADLRHIQAFLGHSNAGTTSRYASLNLPEMKRVWTASHRRAKAAGAET